MEVRRTMMGVIAGMAGGHVRMASGELNHTGGVAYLHHNLGSKKIFVVMQRINSDHSNIDGSNQFTSIMVFGATVEALGLDEEQTYSLNGGNQVSFNSTGGDTNGAYPKGINSFFPNESGSYPSNGVMAYPYRAIRAYDGDVESDNIVWVYPTYGLASGRWVWRAYALD